MQKCLLLLLKIILMSINIKELVYSRNTLEFITVAQEYCAYVENIESLNKPDFINKSLKLITLLYLKTQLLPNFEQINDTGVEKFVSELDYNIVKNSIAQLLDDEDQYLDFFDENMQETPEPVACFISENFADIYQDLKDCTNVFQLRVDDLMNDALFECQNNFVNFWGFKLVNSIKILHLLNLSAVIKPENLNPTNIENSIFNKAKQNYNKNV